MGMDQYLSIPFLGGWTSIYQLFWCSPGVQGFDTLPYPWEIANHDGTIFMARDSGYFQCILDGKDSWTSQGVSQPPIVYIWVNYNDLTATSLGIMVNKGNHPQMALIQVLIWSKRTRRVSVLHRWQPNWTSPCFVCCLPNWSICWGNLTFMDLQVPHGVKIVITYFSMMLNANMIIPNFSMVFRLQWKGVALQCSRTDVFPTCVIEPLGVQSRLKFLMTWSCLRTESCCCGML